jgi:hypothetical protein
LQTPHSWGVTLLIKASEEILSVVGVGLTKCKPPQGSSKDSCGHFIFQRGGLEKFIKNTSVFSHHATSPAPRRYPKLNIFDTENKPQQRRTGENLEVSTDG